MLDAVDAIVRNAAKIFATDPSAKLSNFRYAEANRNLSLR